jgi:two-component system OmpR family sensor kinase
VRLRRRRVARTRLGWYMGRRLRRRIFWWFGVTIVLTFLVASATLSAFGPEPSRARQLLSFAAAGLVLWGISGRIARRLARPFDQLASIASEIGGGRLGARIPLDDCHDEDVAVVGRVMNDLAARIERQLAEQRELLAAVSHEVRTPLARVRILTELARDGADVRKALDDIDAEVVEIDALVGELLASARLEFAAAEPTALDAADAARRALERASVPLAALEAPAPLTVRADPTLLARALANLLDNAQRHAGSVDKLSVTAVDDRVRFAVLDRGPGLSVGEERKIFESFYRGARGRDDGGKKPSLGLGLSLVRRIAEAHGGRVDAENREGGGAIIAIELPAAPA